MNLKLLLFTAATSLVALSTASAQDSAPAFPGAEGFARYTTTGGRSSDGSTTVYHVTTLEDNSSVEGSLRWALKQSGPRTIVFDVSGYIDLTSDLEITSNTTIAGQTAPSPGITLRYYTVKFTKCDNVICRFIRFRRSQVEDVNDGADAAWGRERKNIILDHCSFSWSIDETASFYDNLNFTMQWCNVTESLNNAGHGKSAHGYGGIWGGKGASFHHNFLAHHTNRCPRLNGARYNWDGYDTETYSNSVQAERVDVRNCVMYNWGTGNGAYGGMGGYHNLINNYYKAGPATKNTKRVFQCSTNDSDDSDGALPDGLPGRFYINGNYVTAASSPENYDWSGVSQDSGTGVTVKSNGGSTYVDSEGLYGDAGETVAIKLDEAIDAGEVTTHSATVAFSKILLYCGASLYRDDVDVRNMDEAENGTTTYTGPTTAKAGILDLINDPEGTEDTDLPSYPDLAENTRDANYDTDEDGIPDEWETANGLNPNDASDKDAYTLDKEKGFYTNLEVYLNSIVESIVKAGNKDALVSVDEYYPTTASSSDEENALPSIYSNSDVTAIEYYDLNGRKLSAPAKGISVRRLIFSNGKSATDLVIKK